MSKLLIFLCLFFIGGCKSDIALDAKIFPQNYELSIYEKGQLVSTKAIKSGCDINKVIPKWFLNNLNHWVFDMNTYTPQVVLTSNSLNINFVFDGKIVVINYLGENKEWKQASKSLDTKDSDVLINALYQKVLVECQQKLN